MRRKASEVRQDSWFLLFFSLDVSASGPPTGPHRKSRRPPFFRTSEMSSPSSRIFFERYWGNGSGFGVSTVVGISTAWLRLSCKLHSTLRAKRSRERMAGNPGQETWRRLEALGALREEWKQFHICKKTSDPSFGSLPAHHRTLVQLNEK